jgi:ubiquinone/menaquinone biosynthesis C-methylase UbiE
MSGRVNNWAKRQSEMSEWYDGVLSDPHCAARMFQNDYEPFVPFLRTLRGKVLDIGGGIGYPKRYLPATSSYVCLDPSNAWLTPNWRAISQSDFVQGFGESLPFEAASFDYALSFWSLNHASDPALCMAEMARVLKSRGKALVVLEDMRPTWRDLLTRPLGISPSKRLHYLIDRAFFRAWSPQFDHILITERDFRSWIAQRFQILNRTWALHYLTFYLERF